MWCFITIILVFIDGLKKRLDSLITFKIRLLPNEERIRRKCVNIVIIHREVDNNKKYFSNVLILFLFLFLFCFVFLYFFFFLLYKG